MTNVLLRRGPFTEAVRTSLYTAAGQRAFPASVERAARGDYGGFVGKFGSDFSQFAEGLYLTIACSEASSRIRPEEVERSTSGTFLGDYRVRSELAACARWPKYTPASDFYDAPTSSPPVLVLAGEMDPVGAPEWARSFCAGLPRCRLVEIPDFGHGPFDLDAWSNGDCFDAIAARFLADGEVETACLKGMRPPAFTVDPR
jgi:pimeloyl-ACP methyl ester carboxylesterase